MTTRDTLRSWLKEGAEMGASHLLVVYNPAKERDYPVWVCPPEVVSERYKALSAVVAVYALHLDWEKQLDETKPFHFESVPSDHHLTWDASPEKTQEQVEALYYPAMAHTLRRLYFETCLRHEMREGVGFASHLNPNDGLLSGVHCEFWHRGKSISRSLPIVRLANREGLTVLEMLELFVTRAVVDVANLEK